MTIGERLEEARKRKGISIREVAEATKIRGDYLMAMEDNSMDIPLPEIYKRGFLINYAKFLKVDSDKLMTDYTALQGAAATANRDRIAQGEDREVFGRMELQEEAAPDASSKNGEPQGSPATRQTPPAHPGSVLTDNTLYLKIAAGLMGVVLVVFIVIVIVNLLRSGDEPAVAEETPAVTNSVVTEAPLSVSTDPGAEVAAGPSTIILRASENVIIIVDELQSRERLFSGTLRAGDTQLIEREGRVNIKFSNGSALEVEMPDGSKVRPTAPAMGQTQTLGHGTRWRFWARPC